ncbi:hypothetical protein D3C84_734000 [compost metagenome]
MGTDSKRSAQALSQGSKPDGRDSVRSAGRSPRARRRIRRDAHIACLENTRPSVSVFSVGEGHLLHRETPRAGGIWVLCQNQEVFFRLSVNGERRTKRVDRKSRQRNVMRLMTGHMQGTLEHFRSDLDGVTGRVLLLLSKWRGGRNRREMVVADFPLVFFFLQDEC